MNAGDLIKLQCRPETLSVLATQLESVGAMQAALDWLTSAVWLRAGASDYLATSSTNILADGHPAHPLVIDRVDDFVRQLRSELPDISGRLMARQSAVNLPDPVTPQAPGNLRQVPQGEFSTEVLIRRSNCRSSVHEVASGLLFRFETASSLLIGTDEHSLAMIMTEEPAVIDAYVGNCRAISAAEYLSRYRD